MPLHVKVSGAWEQVTSAFVKVAGVWEEAVAWVKVAGVWEIAGVVISLVSRSLVSITISPVGAFCRFTMLTDGNMVETEGTSPPNAFHQWLGSGGVASDYEVRMTTISGMLSAGTTGTWLAMTSNRFWEVEQSTTGSRTYQGTLEIRRASDSVVLDSCTITMESSVDA